LLTFPPQRFGGSEFIEPTKLATKFSLNPDLSAVSSTVSSTVAVFAEVEAVFAKVEAIAKAEP
jgi:hypothetical protein